MNNQGFDDEAVARLLAGLDLTDDGDRERALLRLDGLLDAQKARSAEFHAVLDRGEQLDLAALDRAVARQEAINRAMCLVTGLDFTTLGLDDDEGT